MQITIREVQIKDAEQVYEVFKQTWLDTYPNKENDITVEDILSRYPIEKRSSTIENYAKFYQNITNNPEAATTLVWVAESDNKILGLVTIDKVEPVRIGALYVLPEFQGKGVGKALMEFILNKFSGQKLQLNVAKYNTKALEFYKRNGFKVTGDIDDPSGALPTGKIIPEVNMVRE